MKATVSENIANSNALVPATACDGVTLVAGPSATVNTASSNCVGGVISVTGTAQANAVTLTYTPVFLPGEATVRWGCTSAAADARYVPAECR
jgi:hypothetical protein